MNISVKQFGQYQSLLHENRNELINRLILLFLTSSQNNEKQIGLKLLSASTEQQIELLEHYHHQDIQPDIQKLIQIDAALSQMEIGLYGTCASCDGEIEEHKLKNQPWAQYCCQCTK